MQPKTFPTVLLGDVHGRYDLLLDALQTLGCVDDAGHWCGGTRRFIQVGDVCDRGPQALDAYDLLMRLEEEARAAGGDVTCLLGNHEIIAMRAGAGDEWYRMNWTFNSGGKNYENWLQRQGQTGDECNPPYPEEFYALFGPQGRIGSWIRQHPVALRLGDYVVVHGAWPATVPAAVEEANAAWAATPADSAGFLAAVRQPTHPAGFQAGLLWCRHQSEEQIVAACERLGCRGLIGGHLVADGIKTSYGGRWIQIDVGMIWAGQWAALGMDEQNRPWALVPGQEPVPVEQDGFVPLPAKEAADTHGEADATPEPAPLRFAPGDLVHAYSSRDEQWRVLVYIHAVAGSPQYPHYTVNVLTYERGEWQAGRSAWPAAIVDRYGRPAPLDTVPAHLLAPSTQPYIPPA